MAPPPCGQRLGRLEVLQGFFCQRIEPACGDILLELTVPRLGIELHEPRTKREELFWGQFAHSGLNLLDSVQTERLPLMLITSKACGEAA